VAEDALAAAVPLGRELHRAGDMVSPRSMAIAVAEGALAGRRV